MATTLDDILTLRPVNAEAVQRHKERMLAEVRAHRLRELREAAGLTQAEVADRIGVTQRQVSKIEAGDPDTSKLTTLRGYVEALGGDLALEFVSGDTRVRIA